MALSTVQSATVYGAGQLQRQLAIRIAEQAETRAQSLAEQAAQAREDADVAIRQAENLAGQSKSARNVATSAAQAVAATSSASAFGRQIGEQADRIYRSMQSEDSSSSLYGSNGRKSGSSYTAGSIFTLAG